MKSKEQLIEEFQKTPCVIGDRIKIYSSLKDDFLSPENIDFTKKEKHDHDVINIEGDFLYIKDTYHSWSTPFKIHKDFVAIKNAFYIGANVFTNDSWRSKIRFGNWNMDSLLHKLGFNIYKNEMEKEKYFDSKNVVNLNWNPFVLDEEGNFIYYQREFCWTLNDKQLLIESIYNGLEIGKIILKHNSFESIEKGLKKYPNQIFGWYDVIDGKQRLNTLLEFVNNKFPDKNGVYYRDFSGHSKHKLLSYQGFTLGEIDEDVTHKDIIKIFLAINFTGVQMSQDHIDFVKAINL